MSKSSVALTRAIAALLSSSSFGSRACRSPKNPISCTQDRRRQVIVPQIKDIIAASAFWATSSSRAPYRALLRRNRASIACSDPSAPPTAIPERLLPARRYIIIVIIQSDIITKYSRMSERTGETRHVFRQFPRQFSCRLAASPPSSASLYGRYLHAIALSSNCIPPTVGERTVLPRTRARILRDVPSASAGEFQRQDMAKTRRIS